MSPIDSIAVYAVLIAVFGFALSYKLAYPSKPKVWRNR